MRKLAAVAGVALVSLAIGSAAPVLLKGANGPLPASSMLHPLVGESSKSGLTFTQAAANNDSVPMRTAKAFAPFLRAIVTHRQNTAEKIFKMRRGVQTTLEQPATARILAKFRKPDEMALTLLGGRILGQDMGILLFTVATEEGPVAFKAFYYAYGNDMNIARLDITDDWDDLERLAATVETLQQPITVPLSAQDIPQ